MTVVSESPGLEAEAAPETTEAVLDAASTAPESTEAAPDTTAAAPVIRRRQFRTAATKSKLSPDEANRQGSAVRTAFERMGREEARAFLNEHHEELGGRPLDIATASAAGLSLIEQAIDARAATLNSVGNAS